MEETMKASSLLTLGLCVLFSFDVYAHPMDIVLRLKEKIPMEDLARIVLDPQSSRYGHFFSPEELRDLVGPSDDEYASLKENLRAENLTIVSESKTRLILTVRGEKAVLENLFS